MPTITLTIDIPAGSDVKIVQKADVPPSDWDVDSGAEYLNLLSIPATRIFAALLDRDHTTTELKEILNYQTEHQVAGALSWPAIHAANMGKPLPWAYDDGIHVTMTPEIRAIFKQAVARLRG